MIFSLLLPASSLVAAAHARVNPDCTREPLASNGICNFNPPPAERAASLVAAMQTQEKLDNLMSKSKGIPRLSLPPYNWWGEALHGVAGAPGINFTTPFNTATSFPMPLLMSATFDDALIHRIGSIIGNEARAFANAGHAPLDFWTPDVNPFRDPRWGRGSETPGEDGRRIVGYTAAMLRGLEGEEKKGERKIVATCKHFVGYDMEAWGGTDRHHFDARISMQDLAEYYMPPFRQCARDSKVGSLMCSYNAVNGVPACADPYILQMVLRQHWGWSEGGRYVTSDCEAVADISANHEYARSNAEGTGLAFRAGMDNSCEYEGSSDIPGAWKQGFLNASVVDRALRRQYEGLVRAGYFDGVKAVYAGLGIGDVNTKDARDMALQVAADGLVMLKNANDTLPLSLKSGSKVAMVGFWANDSSKLSGIYSGPAPYLHTPVYAAQQLGLNVITASGPVLQNTGATDNWTTRALNAAQASDCILYFGGLDTSAAAEGSDRTDISWPTAQLDLIRKLAGLGRPLVVVVLGDMLDNSPLLSLPGVDSIIWANWPGQEGGPAVMQVITGAVAPAGRLPVTQYPANYTKLSMLDMNLRPSNSSPGRTYRWFPSAVQPFGFGLHYTMFKASLGNKALSYSIQDLTSNCNNTYADTCTVPALEVTVMNAGNRTSDFVALAFIKGDVGPKPYPLKTLVSYARLRDIAGSQSKTAQLQLTLGDLARHDELGNLVLYPGEYTLLLDEPMQAELKLTLTGQQAVLDKWPQPPKKSTV